MAVSPERQQAGILNRLSGGDSHAMGRAPQQPANKAGNRGSGGQVLPITFAINMIELHGSSNASGYDLALRTRARGHATFASPAVFSGGVLPCDGPAVLGSRPSGLKPSLAAIGPTQA